MANPHDKEQRRKAAAEAHTELLREMGIDPDNEEAVAAAMKKPEIKALLRARRAQAVTPFIEAKDKAEAEIRGDVLREMGIDPTDETAAAAAMQKPEVKEILRARLKAAEREASNG